LPSNFAHLVFACVANNTNETANSHKTPTSKRV
jgi:hypothetical protein